MVVSKNTSENTKHKETNSVVLSTQRGKLRGEVINNVRRHEGTITVLIENRRPHPKYHKITTTRKKYLVQYDDKHRELPIGSVVELIQIAPVSKKKSFKIETVIEFKK